MAGPLTNEFCMYNRYVDSVHALTPDDPRFCREGAAHLARDGYVGTNADLGAPR